MAEIADLMISGALCEGCGAAMRGGSCGHPRKCRWCSNHETETEVYAFTYEQAAEFRRLVSKRKAGTQTEADKAALTKLCDYAEVLAAKIALAAGRKGPKDD